MQRTLFRSVRTLVFCLILNGLYGQSTLISDSLRAKNPLWSGDTAWMNFTTEGLRTNAPSAGDLHWSLPSKAAINALWQLKISLGFNPSSSNFCEFQFVNAPQGQYAIQLSGNSSDDLSLILRRPGMSDSILASATGYLNHNAPEIAVRILRDSTHTFWVYDADSLLFSTTDSTLRSSQRLTLYCKYTSSRVDKFLFSTLHASGYSYQDTIPARLLEIHQKSPTTIALAFNEPCVPAMNSVNGIIAYQQGRPIDTAHYPQLFEKIWLCTFSKPLPLGPIAFEIQNTLDSALNPSGAIWDVLDIQYTPEQTVAITAIQPFDHATSNFVRMYSPHALNANLHSVDLSGKTKSHPCALDSGFTLLANLDGLPRAGAIWVEKEGIVLGHAAYDDLFDDSNANGYHALFRDTICDLRQGWSVQKVSDAQTQVPVWDSTCNANRPKNLFVDEDNNLWIEWQESLYSFPDRPADWKPEQPLLSRLAHWPKDSALPFGIAKTVDLHALDSGVVLLNEVHFAADLLEEFIEIVNTSAQPLPSGKIWLSLFQNGNLIRSAPLDNRRPNFKREGLVPALLPEEILALSAPFSLPNDTCQLIMHTIEGNPLDEMQFWPLKSPLEHRSFERVSMHTTGKSILNWHHHIPHLGKDSEGSPNARNSVAGALPTQLAQVNLERNWISLDPRNYHPTTVLWVGAEAGERVWAEVRDGSGRIVEVLLAGVKVGVGEDGMGLHAIVLGPEDWGWHRMKSGIYWIHCKVSGIKSTRKKSIPISIFNP